MFRSPYNTLTEKEGYLLFVRTPAPYLDLDLLDSEARELQELLPPGRRAQLHCLRDLRQARGRNDPRFEARLKETRLQVFKGWKRLAVLMGSSAGVLQGSRLLRELGIAAYVTTDEQAAIDYLR
ncbi:MAG: hypothetical protein AAGH15_09945 [Myxococcota bacterium]